jgi:hypothetical protein
MTPISLLTPHDGDQAGLRSDASLSCCMCLSGHSHPQAVGHFEPLNTPEAGFESSLPCARSARGDDVVLLAL